MARVKIYDKTAREWVYADKAFAVGGGGGGSEVEKQATGKIVSISAVPDTPIKVTSKITNWDTGFSAAKYLSFRHVRSKNLVDIVTLMGGAGKTITSSGLTATLNNNGTATITGSVSGENWGIKAQNVPQGQGVGIFPPGTYTVPPHLVLELKKPATSWESIIYNAKGTFTVDEPFWIRTMWIYYNGTISSVNETIPLYMVAGSAPLNTGYAYEGDFYQVALTTPIANGEFNWETGELTDADGNVVENKGAQIHNLVANDGINTFISSTGDSIVTYTGKSGGSSGGSSGGTTEDVSIAFNPDAWGLPVLRLNGVRTGISKENAVSLTYIYEGKEGDCTLKWQGSSSIKWPKKNYTIKFKDENGIVIRDEWGAQKKYCLKANYIDFSHARNLVNAKLWGQVVKSRKNVDSRLKALVNAGAVDGFPICLVINEEYQGIYTFNIPKDGWMMGMTGSNAQEAILCASGAESSAGALFKTKNIGLRIEDGDEGDFDLEYLPDEGDPAQTEASLERLIAACIDSKGTDLDTTIAKYLDWDSAIDFICFTTLINGFDCLSKNYLLATFDGTKWFFSAYDMDCTYGLHWDGTKFFRVREAYGNRASFGQFCSLHRVFELVKLYKKDALKARYAELRADILSEDNVATQFANFIGLIPQGVYDQECQVWKTLPNTSTNNLSQIRDFYRLKCADLDAEIKNL